MKKEKTDVIGISEMLCPVCGRMFIVTRPEIWAYKYIPKKGKTAYYCSYGCTLEAEHGRIVSGKVGNRLHAQQRKARYERGAKIDELRKSGVTIAEISKKLGICATVVRRTHRAYLDERTKEECQ